MDKQCMAAYLDLLVFNDITGNDNFSGSAPGIYIVYHFNKVVIDA